MASCPLILTGEEAAVCWGVLWTSPRYLASLCLPQGEPTGGNWLPRMWPCAEAKV